MDEVSFLKDSCSLNDELIKKITESCDTKYDFLIRILNENLIIIWII